MIITRSPLRITLGGGGTDLPAYYRQHGGFLISAAINKYVYVTVTRPFVEGIYLKYTKLEHVKTVAEVQHPIIRECLRHLNLRTPQIEITTLADIPSGTGLGSSGSFTTALLKALYAHRRQPVSPGELAALACEIEIERLGEPIGKQDQYIAAYGGVTCFTFHEDDSVKAQPLVMRTEALHILEDNILLFFTGFSRSASSMLRTPPTDEYLHQMNVIGVQSYRALFNYDFKTFGALLHEHWMLKRADKSQPQIDNWYGLGIQNGALGGKLVGAGGGGFLLFYAEDHARLRAAMAKAGLAEVRFRFDWEGTKVLV
jgi:D-glycero-alpha-D-manno-heptose-7-phosphate kinase